LELIDGTPSTGLSVTGDTPVLKKSSPGDRDGLLCRPGRRPWHRQDASRHGDRLQAIQHHHKRVRFFSTVELVKALEQEKLQGKPGQIAARLTHSDLVIKPGQFSTEIPGHSSRRKSTARSCNADSHRPEILIFFCS
jgi:hypothetical protein